jgi:hypothetical protein
MKKLDQGQCEGFCSMCDIKDCHFKGATDDPYQHKLDIATDRMIERIMREDAEEQNQNK